MANERTSPPSRPVTSQFSRRASDEPAPLSSGRATAAAGSAQEARSATDSSAEDSVFKERFIFIETPRSSKSSSFAAGGSRNARPFSPSTAPLQSRRPTMLRGRGEDA